MPRNYEKRTAKVYNKTFEKTVWQPLMNFARELPLEQQIKIARGEYENSNIRE